MQKNKSILLCLIASVLVLFKILFNNNFFLILFLILITYAILQEKNEYRINYLLYFISWVYVIKFDLSQFSLIVLLSAVYCVVTVIYIIVHQKRFPINLLIVSIIFLCYITFSLINGITQSVFQPMGFILGYLVIILAGISLTPNTRYKDYFFHYSIGILVGSIIRLLGYVIPSIESYIDSMGRINTVSTDGILYYRFAGLDIDPNYYAIQVMLAISLNILMIFRSNKKKTFNIIMTVALVIFGLLSLSKMYLITLFTLNIIVVFVLISKNIFSALKYLMAVSILCSLLLYIYGPYFYNAYLFRFFAHGEDLSNITTGRSEKWGTYLHYIFNNPHTFLFGNGIANGPLNGQMPHNMYIFALFQNGVLGIMLYILFLFYIYNTLKMNYLATNSINLSLNIIPLLIILISNFSLDSFAMDYFPLHLFLVMISVLANKNINKTRVNFYDS